MPNELMVIGPEQYPALASQTIEAMRHNLTGEGVTAADLVRIKVPSGGATVWSVPNDDGEEEPVKSLEGVILHIGKRRGYWPGATPSGDPPACSSTDASWGTGVGTPGGDCETCPHNQWASGKRADGTAGRGKACRERRLIFLLRAGRLLPEIVDVAPGSLKSLKKYLLTLPVPFIAVVTRLDLARERSKDGIDYAQIRLSRAATLDADGAKRIGELAKVYEGLFASAQVEADEGDGNHEPVEV